MLRESGKAGIPGTVCIFITESPDYSASVYGTMAGQRITRINWLSIEHKAKGMKNQWKLKDAKKSPLL